MNSLGDKMKKLKDKSSKFYPKIKEHKSYLSQIVLCLTSIEKLNLRSMLKHKLQLSRKELNMTLKQNYQDLLITIREFSKKELEEPCQHGKWVENE